MSEEVEREQRQGKARTGACTRDCFQGLSLCELGCLSVALSSCGSPVVENLCLHEPGIDGIALLLPIPTEADEQPGWQQRGQPGACADVLHGKCKMKPSSSAWCLKKNACINNCLSASSGATWKV